MVKKDSKIEKGSVQTHIPEVLLEGAGTPTTGSMGVKEPDCERWRLRPVHAALLLDTSLSSAACGFETILHFAEHHELHLGMSTGL